MQDVRADDLSALEFQAFFETTEIEYSLKLLRQIID